MCTECETKPAKIGMPDAWYELASRIESAKAVACYIPEALPGKLDGPAECAFNLTNAVIDLLELAMADINRLEEQLKAGGLT